MAENQHVGIIYSPWVEEAEPLANTLVDALSKEHKPWVCSVLDLEGNSDMAKRCSTFVTIGGDGTILRTVRLAAPAGIPIVGVNLGRVGFMAELPAEEAVARVNSFASGEGWMEERTMLEAKILPVRQSTEKPLSYSGLNDAVVSRTKPSRMVYVEVRVDKHSLASYAADAVIVSTATGSTGYALGAGGPILYAESTSLLVQPVVPQLADSAAIVLHPGAVVEIEIEADQDAMVSVDGYMDLDLSPGDTVRVQEGPHKAKFLRQGSPHTLPSALSHRLSSIRRQRNRGTTSGD